jgi:hypothetical protein
MIVRVVKIAASPTNPAETQGDEVAPANADRSHYDRDGYCDNPARGF